MSNLPFARIIVNRNLYNRGEFDKVDDEFEQETLIRFAEGHADIWRQFVSRAIPRLYGMFMKNWPNPSLAEELVQKTIFDAVRGLDSYDSSKGNPDEWILGIARNNIRLEIRRRASRPGPNGDISHYLEKVDARPLPDEVLERRETVEIVRLALGRLKSKEQSVLKAKYVDGLPARDIAQRIDVTEKAVHSLLYRAKNSLRRELERQVSLTDKE